MWEGPPREAGARKARMDVHGIIPAALEGAPEAMTTITPPRYTATAVVLHWLVAVLIVCGFTLGLSMVPLPLSRQKLECYLWHKSIGLTVFLLTCLRLAWRSLHPPPPLPPMPEWQRKTTAIAHGALYALLLLIPLSGWLSSSSILGSSRSPIWCPRTRHWRPCSAPAM